MSTIEKLLELRETVDDYHRALIDWRVKMLTVARPKQIAPPGRWRSWLIMSGRGFGKALALDTPIPTLKGWSTMGELKRGDIIFDEKGNPCSVTKAHDVMHGRPCYKVTFSTGETIVCDEDHLWLTKDKACRDYECGLESLEKRPLVRTTEEIAKTLFVGPDNEVNHSIDSCNVEKLPQEGIKRPPDGIRFIIGAEPVESVPVRCITVNSPSRLFLCTRSYIPTHNSWTASHDAIWHAASNPGWYIAMVSPTIEDVRKVSLEGPAGVLNMVDPALLKGGTLDTGYNISDRIVTFANGSTIRGFGAEKPNRFRGPQHHRVLLDELSSFPYIDESWSNLRYGNRLGDCPQFVITTTPKPIKFLKDMISKVGDKIILTRGSTYENSANLSKDALEEYTEDDGTRLGRQEIYGDLLMDVAGALWKWSDIKRTSEVSDLDHVVVAVDPSGKKTGDACGIVAAGRKGKEFFVLADATLQGTPSEWARAAINLYDQEDILADRLVAESNFGADMVKHTILTEAQNMHRRGQREQSDISYKEVRASRGKAIRAEPISALYEQGRVHHVGSFPALEEEMTSFTREYDRDKQGSPNRVDALVWALTELSSQTRRSGAMAMQL